MSLDIQLNDLRAFVKSDLDKTNATIHKAISGKEALIFVLSDYLMSSGGKRLRPMLTLVSAKLCNYQGEYHVDLAAAVEFIHAATLLHDDVVDESDLRRGQPTANNKWGNKASILVGDFLLSQAFQLMVKTGSIRILDILSGTSAIIAEGEVMQLAEANNLNISQEQYFQIITAKTAALFGAACQIGAVISGVENKIEQALYNFGLNLGIAFQITDDILDYSADQAELGKRIGDDFREGKVTLPVILAYQTSNEQQRQFWERTLKQLDQKEDDLEIAIKLLKENNALESSLVIAYRHIEKAQQSLEMLPNGKARELLLDALAFSLERSY